MSTKGNYSINEIGKNKNSFQRTRVIIESAFYCNNVVRINTLKEAYEIAKNSRGTIVTDIPVYKGEEFGLEQDSKVLVFNDGAVTGRYSAARIIAGKDDKDKEENIDKIIMDAVYNLRNRTLYHAEVYVGLHEDFIIKAHLLIPEGFEMILYNWMLNFQYMSDEYVKKYKNSLPIGGGKESDIYIVADPAWEGSYAPGVDINCLKDPEKKVLSYFNPTSNCACILGMRYFGEYKKGTLTLAWAIANRNGYISCHGGEKRIELKNKKFVMAVFGLSGSGKSTIIHAKHNNKYNISVLHDDAFIINEEDYSSIRLEPTYFDKVKDYSPINKYNKYLLSLQNVGVTYDNNLNVQIITEDIRNGNGRAIKSKFLSDNIVCKIDEKINAVFWIMRDSTLPPVVKLENNIIAATFGALLVTKRTNAERLIEKDENNYVIVPYANPFRTYELKKDYDKFKNMFKQGKVDCYVINTSDFMGKKIKVEDTLNIIEKIIENKAIFEKWGNFSEMKIMKNLNGYKVDMKDETYLKELEKNIDFKINYLENQKDYFEQLPKEVLLTLKNLKKDLISSKVKNSKSVNVINKKETKKESNKKPVKKIVNKVINKKETLKKTATNNKATKKEPNNKVIKKESNKKPVKKIVNKVINKKETLKKTTTNKKATKKEPNKKVIKKESNKKPVKKIVNKVINKKETLKKTVTNKKVTKKELNKKPVKKATNKTSTKKVISKKTANKKK